MPIHVLSVVQLELGLTRVLYNVLPAHRLALLALQHPPALLVKLVTICINPLVAQLVQWVISETLTTFVNNALQIATLVHHPLSVLPANQTTTLITLLATALVQPILLL